MRTTLLWIALLFASGVYLYLHGFLLTRYELTELSRCDDPPVRIPGSYNTTTATATQAGAKDNDSHADPPSSSSSSSSSSSHTQSCWLPERRFSRAVLLVIDALRYDFARWDDSLATATTDEVPPYVNRLPILRRLINRQPHNAVLYRFAADAPTVTMQRLKGLTTGGLPTFIDISANFASETIAEDSLVQQAKLNARTTVFMGDDTWTALFPTHFDLAYPYPSFNVKDLHTVDNGCIDHLLPEMRNTSSDWNLLIAHFLGVDHVGHRYGPYHPIIADKLRQMDRVITDVVDALDDDTLLVVMGDHGMTPGGNHGGASDEEVNAALFLYAKTPFNFDLRRHYRQHLHDRLDTVQYTGSHAVSDAPHHQTTIPQVDLVPTLSLLLGLPIPFGSLGTVIPDLFFVRSQDLPADARARLSDAPTAASPTAHVHPETHFTLSTATQLAGFRRLLQALHVNAAQISRFLDVYHRLAPGQLPDAQLTKLRTLYQEAEMLYIRAGGSQAHNLHHLKLLCSKYQQFTTQTLDMCRHVWARFDLSAMRWALVIFVLALALTGALALRAMALHLNPPTLAMSVGALVGVILAHLCPSSLFLVLDSPSPMALAALGSVLGLAWHMLVHGVPRVLAYTRAAASISTLHLHLFDKYMLLATAMHAAGLFSNSFIVAEHTVLAYLQTGAALLLLIATLNTEGRESSHRSLPSALAHALLHLATVKAHEWLPISPAAELDRQQPTHMLLVCALPSLLMPLVIIKRHLWARSSPMTRLALGAHAILAHAAMLLFFSLQTFTSIDAQPAHLRLGLPRLTYALSALGLLALPLVRRAGKDNNPRQTTQDADTNETGDDTAAAATGALDDADGSTAGVHHLRCYAAWLVLTPSLALALGPSSPCIVLLLYLHVQSLLDTVGHLARVHAANALSHVSTGPFFLLLGTLLSLAFSAHRYFFETGHQNDFGALQVGNTFVGIEEFNFYANGALMGLNTFASFLLIVLLLPVAAHVVHSHTGHRTWALPLAIFALYYGLNAALSAFFVYGARRHLMVWAIFAPKLVFDCAILLVVLSLLILLSLALPAEQPPTQDFVKKTR